MRFRFAPSSMLENYSNGEDERCDNIISHSSPEAETIFARFMSTCSGNDSSSPDVMRQIINKSMEQEPERINGFLPSLQMGFHSPPPQPSPPPPPEISLENQSSNPTENSYRNSNSMHVDQQQRHHSKLKMGSGDSNSSTTNSSNLIRHSSSPAGLFSQLSVEKGYSATRGIGDFRAKNNSTTGDKTAPIISRLKGQLSFPSRPPSSPGLLSQISEVENESMEEGNSREEGSLGSGNNRFLTGFTNASWKDSSEKATILQLQDAVPCKIRAKRGYATHPRSIAERVRRTRISERMRKLQELVPNMDKQTNTADMLDFAVEYIKDLQKQVKTLNANQANCVCSRQKL